MEDHASTTETQVCEKRSFDETCSPEKTETQPLKKCKTNDKRDGAATETNFEEEMRDYRLGIYEFFVECVDDVSFRWIAFTNIVDKNDQPSWCVLRYNSELTEYFDSDAQMDQFVLVRYDDPLLTPFEFDEEKCKSFDYSKLTVDELKKQFEDKLLLSVYAYDGEEVKIKGLVPVGKKVDQLPRFPVSLIVDKLRGKTRNIIDLTERVRQNDDSSFDDTEPSDVPEKSSDIRCRETSAKKAFDAATRETEETPPENSPEKDKILDREKCSTS
jgi:hypothetical protein